jgi:hypothetical protein
MLTCSDCGHTDRGDGYFILTTKVLCYYCIDDSPSDS